MKSNNVRKLVTMGILIALSIILILSPLRFPFPTAPFLEYEPGNVPIIIGGFIFGPLSGIACTIVASIVQAITVSSGSGWIGCIMHIFATSSLVGISSKIYSRKKTIKSAIIGLICGSLAMTAIMVLLNLIFYPLFAGTPFNSVLALILPAILPFNLMKAGINSIISLLIFKSSGEILIKIVKK